jgi:hypothetical protein
VKLGFMGKTGGLAIGRGISGLLGNGRAGTVAQISSLGRGKIVGRFEFFSDNPLSDPREPRVEDGSGRAGESDVNPGC